MLSTFNSTMQFGAKPLFEQITATFSDGNRYGLIGANEMGKATLARCLTGELTPTVGQITRTENAEPGTPVFVFHGREFVGGLAKRTIEVRSDGTIEDFTGTFDDYLTAAPLVAEPRPRARRP